MADRAVTRGVPPLPGTAAPALARRIGLFDATLVVMGGIVGSGIFVTPASVAQAVSGWGGMIGVWLAGGAVALLGAFVYADLSAQRPLAGGQYVYLREAFHPALAFLYGWALLIVIQTGGMAACAITFARYFAGLSGIGVPEGAIAAAAMALLTLVNCLGVAAGSRTQSALMVIKIAAIALLIGSGLLLGEANPAPAARVSHDYGPAMIAILFSYGGWQTSCFVAGELKDPGRDLPRALVAGVLGVIVLYTGVAVACARVLGMEGLAQSAAPALEVARRTLGPRGATLIAAGIAVSSLGFLSQSILTAPRVYFAMAEDGVFLKSVARVHPRTRAPVVAILLQGALTIAIALLGTFEAILRYVVSIDFIFFGLTAACIFVFARRGERTSMPGHPLTTLLFIAACFGVVAATFLHDPEHSFIGLALTLAGLPVYLLRRRFAR
jgi:APA family basic amino acid/polyamine antiporter